MKSSFLFPLILLLLSVVCDQSAAAQDQAAPLTIGQTFTLASATLRETRRINVYLPPGYADSATLRLPVLYMPDGGMAEDFLHVAGLVQVGTGNYTMRPFIVVGIENTQRRRDMTGPTTNAEDRKIAPQVGGSAAFRKFIRTELMPTIRQRYRTTAETAIVGESLAGLFVVETWLLEPDLFDTYVAFDPSLWWNNGELVAQADKIVRAYAGPAKTLYVAFSSDTETATTTRRFAATLKSAAPAKLTSYYQAMPEETHATIYHPAALRAFRIVFKPHKAAPTK
ncbi:putative esterase [Hymenobacter roseosalivarius DSM 11622]|uniref:Putative esterase n=1 Tax=Hymenobacter roseosalivarius DSM 11622 TaxID=645990 RepID=A0A1W1VJT7_9BACT|nr:alpha/beta hydrolase-fold protein [Hymenobacter roseosalivarius]SMB93321.1 putative esterase [Hymenobacter roseosalivarius DSM 11622]